MNETMAARRRWKVTGVSIVVALAMSGSGPAITAATAAGARHRPAPRSTRNLAVTTQWVTAWNGSRQLPTLVYAPVGPGGPWPLVVFAHGFAATPGDYDPLLRTVAAAGYVVAAPASPGLAPGQAPLDERQLPYQPGDVSSALTMMSTASPVPVNAGRAAVMGHSDGGSTVTALALSSQYADRRFSAYVVAAGGFDIAATYGPFNPAPMLVTVGDHDEYGNWPGTEAIYERAGDPRYFIRVYGGTHMGPLTGTSAQSDSYRAAVVDFFDTTIGGDPYGRVRLDADADVNGLSLVRTPTPIEMRYLALGGQSGLLGPQVTPDQPLPGTSGFWATFALGALYASWTGGIHEVNGAINDEHRAGGGGAGPLGFPLTDESTTPDGAGRYNHFERGSVYWTLSTGAHEVHGGIRDRWSWLGWERSPLGYPTSDELTTPDGTGRYNRFANGNVYASYFIGVHEVHGAIFARWGASGWERGQLGYPITDEYGGGSGIDAARASSFQSGVIYASYVGGVHALTGPIAARYVATGSIAGPLGPPTTDVVLAPDGTSRTDFRHGSITYDPATANVVVTVS